MKKYLSVIISSILVFTISFTACKKDDPQPSSGGVGPAPPAITAMVDGEKWEALSNKAKVTISDSTYLTGMAPDSSVINIIINDQIITPGSYTFSNWSGHRAEYKSNLNSTDFWSTIYQMATGTLEITHVNTTSNRISGTFSFKAYNPSDNTFIEITDGKLSNLIIQIVNSPPPVPCNLYFKVNNVAFNSSSAITVYEFSNDSISISIFDMTGKGLGLIMPVNIGTGTYSLGPSGISDKFGVFSPNFSTVTESISGTLKITYKNNITGDIAGTFNFISIGPGGNPTFNITDGCFDTQ